MARRKRLTQHAFNCNRLRNAHHRKLRIEALENRHLLAGLVVSSLDDNMVADGLITLREALHAANNDTVADSMVPTQVGSGTDVISFDPSLFSDGPATIVLTEGQLVIASNLTLQGPGADLLTIDASGNDLTPDEKKGDGSRVIDINDGNDSILSSVEIHGLTITGGDIGGESYEAAQGGGIRNREHLILADSAILNNAVVEGYSGGGGLSSRYFNSVTEIVRTRISGNTAHSGGGVYAGGTTTIRQSTISGNDAFLISPNSFGFGSGGGVLKNSGTLNIIESTISDNRARGWGYGGGLWTRYGTTTITNSTISGNSADDRGGGIHAPLRSTSAKLYINHSTISNNSVVDGKGGGVYLGIGSSSSTHGTAKFNHTIIAGNSDNGTAPDLDFTSSPAAISLEIDYSVIGQNTGSGLTAAPTPDSDGNLIGGAGPNAIDPLLSELADHGGPTLTHRLKAGSPAINVGNAALLPGQGSTPLTDQRGTGNPRIRGHAIDIGAVEVSFLPGDYDFSSVVDQADHAFWFQNFGASSGDALQADGNNDGTVNAADYVLWRKLRGTYEDDHGDSSDVATTLNVPALVQGNLQAANDVDWFKFTATSGKTYQLAINLLQLTNSRLRLIGTDGTTVLLDDNDGGAALLDWMAPADGTYYLEVSSASDVGTYQLSILADDHGNSAAATTLVSTPTFTPSTTVGNLHNASDVDWFRFTAISGYTYVFDTVLLGLASSGLRLIGTDGTTVLQQDTDGGTAQIIWAAPQSGTFYLEVSGVSGSTGTYQLKASRDEANTAALAGTVGIPSNTNATIFQAGDVDWFRFTIAGAGIATVSTSLGTLGNSALHIYASDGTTLIDSDTDGGEGYIEWAATAGTYYARVSELDGATGSYTLHVAVDVPDDHGNSSTTATHIFVPGTAEGIIEQSADEDWFSFNAESGVSYTIATFLGTLNDSVLYLYDSNEAQIAFNDDFDGLASQIDWIALSSGVYYAVVRSFGSSYTGTYSLSINIGGTVGDDHGNDASSATPIGVPETAAGVIEVSGDRDWFSFTAQAGTQYVIKTTLADLDDSILELYDTDGVTDLRYNDDYDGLASQIWWTAATSGTYYIAVSGYSSSAGGYSLFLEDLGPGNPADDHGNLASIATRFYPYSTPYNTPGTLHSSSDVDWFRFSASAGRTYVFDTVLSGLASSGLRLVGTDGTTTLQQDTDGGTAQIIWTAPQHGVYYLEVSSVAGSSGAYQLRASRDDADTAILADFLYVTTTLSPTIYQPGDVDWFELYIEQADTITVSTTLGTLASSVLHIYADDGTTLIGSDTDGGAAQVQWDASAGTYLLRVSAIGDLTGGYTLTIAGTDSGGAGSDGGMLVLPRGGSAEINQFDTTAARGGSGENTAARTLHSTLNLPGLPTSPRVNDFWDKALVNLDASRSRGTASLDSLDSLAGTLALEKVKSMRMEREEHEPIGGFDLSGVDAADALFEGWA